MIIFTFQSGYIQITINAYLQGAYLLYIPIWLYSNWETIYKYIVCKNLYIPIWLYSNQLGNFTAGMFVSLHSNLVIFKCNVYIAYVIIC